MLVDSNDLVVIYITRQALVQYQKDNVHQRSDIEVSEPEIHSQAEVSP